MQMFTLIKSQTVTDGTSIAIANTQVVVYWLSIGTLTYDTSKCQGQKVIRNSIAKNFGKNILFCVISYDEF